jgi:hypothetical protein
LLYEEAFSLNVGDTVFYRLKLSDLPINLERVWKGKIESVYSSFVLVSSLDEGYEGLCEAVWPSQIVKIGWNSCGSGRVGADCLSVESVTFDMVHFF